MKRPASKSEAAQKGRQASPWSKGPMCDTGRAKASYIVYRKRGKANAPTRRLGG